MVSTKQNSKWFSNVYQQGTGENDWKDHQVEMVSKIEDVYLDKTIGLLSLPEYKNKDNVIFDGASVTFTPTYDFIDPSVTYNGISTNELNIANAHEIDLDISPDGTKLYVADSSDDAVYQYSTTVPFDFSGTNMTYDGSTGNLGTISGEVISTPKGAKVTPDGSQLILLNSVTGASELIVFNLITPYDITDVTYAYTSQNLHSLQGNMDSVISFDISPDGKYINIIGNVYNIYNFETDTPWDFQSGNITYNHLSNTIPTMNALNAIPLSMAYTPDGHNVYITDSTDDTIYKYRVPVPFTSGNMEYVGKINYDISAITSNVSQVDYICLSKDGSKLFVLGGGAEKVACFTSTLQDDGYPPRLQLLKNSDGTQSTTLNTISSLTIAERGLVVSPDGTKLYIGDNTSTNRTVQQFSTTVPFDFSGTNVSYDGSPSSSLYTLSSNLATDFTSLVISDDGTKIYTDSNGKIYQFSTDTAWDFTSSSTVTYDGVATSTFATLNAANSNPNNFVISPDGLEIYVLDATDHDIFQYTSSVAWDFTGTNLSANGQSSTAFDILNTPNATTDIMRISDNGEYVYILDTNDKQLYQYKTSQPWVFTGTNMSYIGTQPTDFDNLNANNTIYNNFFLAKNGKQIYVAGNNNVFSYSLNYGNLHHNTSNYTTINNQLIGKDITNISYDSSASISAANSDSLGICHSADGTKFYVTDEIDDMIYYYDLTTDWNFLTGGASTHTSIALTDVSLSNGANTKPAGICMSPDGTKFYVMDGTNDKIYQYSTSVAYDVTSLNLSYDGTTTNSLPVISSNALIMSAHNFKISSNGLKIYTLGTDEKIHQFSTDTAWDFTSSSTVTYDGASVDLDPGTFSFFGDLYIHTDGKMIVILANDRFLLYESSVAWDFTGTNVSHLNSANNTVSTISGNLNGSSVAFIMNQNGKEFYTLDYVDNKLYRYFTTYSVFEEVNYSKTYIPATTDVYYDSSPKVFSLLSNIKSTLNLVSSEMPTLDFGASVKLPFNNTVDTIFSTNDTINGTEYQSPIINAMTHPATNAINYNSLSSGLNASAGKFNFNSDGTKIFVLDSSDASIYIYSLPVPWDLSNAIYENTKTFNITNLNSLNAAPLSFEFSIDGTKLYANDSVDNLIYEYDLGTAWEPNTAVYNSVSFSFVTKQALNADCEMFRFSTDGTKLYILDITDLDIYQYNLTTPWDLSGTITYHGNYAIGSSNGNDNPTSFCFDKTGGYLYITDSTDVRIYQYVLSTKWDISSVPTTDSYTIDPDTLNVSNGSVSDILFDIRGDYVYILDGVDDTVYRYQAQTTLSGDISSQITGISVANGITTLDITPSNDFATVTLEDRSVSRDFTTNNYNYTNKTRTSTTDIITGGNSRYLQWKIVGEEQDAEVTSSKINLWTV